MQSCCLIGCESYKYVTKQKIGYFKFPLHDQELLQKWLNQIRIPDWIPTDAHQICSTHFHIDDIDFTPRFPVLRNNAVPMIFPLKHFQHIYINDSYSSSVTSTKIREATQKNILNNLKHSKKKLTVPIAENPTSIQINQLMKPLRIENPTVRPLNPYIFIVSTFDEKSFQSPLLNTTKSKNQPILKIEIDKKIHSVSKSHENSFSGNNVNHVSEMYNKDFNKDTFMEEVQIEDITASKVVVFKLNRSTGEIKVSKRKKLKVNNNDSKTFGSPKSTQTNIGILNARKRKSYETENSFKKKARFTTFHSNIQISSNNNAQEMFDGMKNEKNMLNTNSHEKTDSEMHNYRKIPILRKFSRKKV